MPALLEEIIIITSQGKYLPFFNRYYGQSGRDIAAVKVAIGLAYFGSLPGGDHPVDNSIGSSWFQCGTNNRITEQSLRKFDKKFKLELMAFQRTNQFLIVSYYFEKYSAPEVTSAEDIRTEIQNAMNLFDVEFGSIGEGTIAILHGWRPSSIAYNHSFVTDYETVIDQIPQAMFSMVGGPIQNPPSSVVTSFVSRGTPGYSEAEEFFNENSHSAKNIYQRISSTSRPVYVRYTPSAVAADMKESQLFAAANSVMSSSLQISPYEVLDTDRAELMAPIFAPDHLSDPDPFYVTANKIGFFDKTNFTLQTLPEFSNISQTQIIEMEEQALMKVLQYYNKPMYWLISSDLKDEDTVSFTRQEDADTYLKDPSAARVTTQAFWDSNPEFAITPEEQEAFGVLYLKYLRDIQDVNGQRPIRFVEFRTPSLRPGDVYRAYFEVQKSFLDMIETGDSEEEISNAFNTPSGQGSASGMQELEEQINSQYCIENAETEEEAEIIREKYRAFAMKKKLEISREIRSKTMLAAAAGEENLGNLNIDLGAFGNIPFANLLDDTSLDLGDIGGSIGDALSNWAARELPVAEASNPLVIHMSDLKEGITQLTTMFRSDKAKKDLEAYKLKTNSQKLDLEREANNLAPLAEMIRALIVNNEEFVKKVKKTSASLNEIVDEKRTGFRSSMSGTKIIIKFTEDSAPQIVSINLENKRYFKDKPTIWNKANYEPLKGPMTIPRTVNYLKNIYNLIPLGVQSWQQAAEQLVGVGSSPCSDSGDSLSAGAGLIMRYTINGDGTRTEFEGQGTSYNPFHNWKDDLLEREEIKRISEAYDKIMESEILWGVDVAIPELGPSCSLDDLYKEVINRKNLAKLLCDFASCIQLPNINIKLPNLNLPEIPEIPIFQYPWLDSSTILEQIEAALLQLLCAFIRNLFDILGSPFCTDQLIEDLYGSASDAASPMQAALAESLTETGVPKSKGSNAANFIGDLINFLTPREVCALLGGDPVNRQVYNMIQNLAGNYDLASELDTVEKINIFFQSIGIYVPQEMISRLCSTDNILGSRTCEDTTNLLTRIRNAATRGGVPQERVNEAVALAEQNLMNKSKALEMLTGDFGIEELLPDIQANSELTEALQRSSKTALDSALSLAKISFMSSMRNYKPSLFLSVSSMVSIDDPEYDPEATMRFLRAANNLQAIKGLDLTGKDFKDATTVDILNKTLLKLCDDYEKMNYTTNSGDIVEVYRSQIYPPNQQEILEDSGALMGAINPYENVKTSLRGSLIYDYDVGGEFGISADGDDQGIEPLFRAAPRVNRAEINDPDSYDQAVIEAIKSQREVMQKQIYKNIFEYLLPVTLDVLDYQKSEAFDVAMQFTKSIVISSWENWLDDSTGAYGARLVYQANPDEEEQNIQQRDHDANIGLCASYIRAINSVVQRYQRDIESTIEKVFKVVSRDKLLEVIRDFYNIELEAQREDGPVSSQLIVASSVTHGVKLELKHPALSDSISTVMEDKDTSSSTVTTSTIINDGFFYGTPQNSRHIITLCDNIPERYRDAFDQDREDNPMRRSVFRRQLFSRAEELYNHYRVPETAGTTLDTFDLQLTNLSNDSLFEQTEDNLFLNVFEGVVEQLISYIGESRMFTDAAYLDRIDSRLKSRSFYDTTGDNACIVNPNNLFSEGPVKFDELVTNWFGEQYAKELSDPTNSIYTMDYSKPGPFEKALMSTAVLGFIRVVCLDALLKGALTYSVWDVSFLAQDKLFFEYMCGLVENAFEKERPFVENSIMVDNVFTKVAGTNNRKLAIRKIVNKEIHGYIGDLSKIIFENDKDTDYHNWFLSKMQIVNAPFKRRGPGGFEDIWISELKESDINRYRKNSFTFLERYIRTNGQYDIVLGPTQGLGARQQEALYNFIRFNGYSQGGQDYDYPESFRRKLYDPNDDEFLSVPIGLDIPSREETLAMNLASSELGERTVSIEDNDQWPSKELYSLEDFEALIGSLYSNSPGVEQYVFHLLKKHYEPDNSRSHGKPKTLLNKLPIKAIKRERTYFRIDDQDRLSARHARDFEQLWPKSKLQGEGSSDNNQWQNLNRSTTSKPYSDYIIGQGNDGDLSFNIDFQALDDTNLAETNFLQGNIKMKYDSRFYISSMEGKDVISRPQDISITAGHELRHPKDIENQGFTRNVTFGKTLDNEQGEELFNIFDPDSEPELQDIDVIKGVDEDYAGDIKNKTIFANQTGKVDENFYNAFLNIVGDNIEQETWEEYVIDLVGDASPIFNQPGYSNYDPSGNIGSNQGARIGSNARSRIARAFEGALCYINDSGGGESIIAAAELPLKDHANQQSQVIFATAAEGVDRENLAYEDGPISQDAYLTEAYPARGIQFVAGSTDQKLTGTQDNQSISSPTNAGEDWRKASGYAFYNNNIGLAFPDATTALQHVATVGHPVWGYDEKAAEVLGENQYKIPLRILITQVKNSNGTIKQCYVRYLIPKVTTFGEYASDDFSFESKRARYLADETEKALTGYRNFIQGSFERIFNLAYPGGEYVHGIAAGSSAERHTEENAAYQYFNNDLSPDGQGTRMCASYFACTATEENNNALQPTKHPAQGSHRYHTVNWMLGRRGGFKEQNGGVAPVLFRSFDHRNVSRQSLGIAFLSNEKLWSRVGRREAAEGEDHFAYDRGPSNFHEFDKFFSGNIGGLLKKNKNNGSSKIADIAKNINNRGMQLGDYEDGAEFINDNYDFPAGQHPPIQYFTDRHNVYDRGSRHWLYDRSVDDLMNQGGKEALITMGNLVSWFGQRRIDGFYGATSSGVKGGFTVTGNVLSDDGRDYLNTGAKVDPSLEVYRREAADFDCGPSLFYGDRRILAESFQVCAKAYIDEAYSGGIFGLIEDRDNFTKLKYLNQYKNLIDAFLSQNAYKTLFHSNALALSTHDNTGLAARYFSGYVQFIIEDIQNNFPNYSNSGLSNEHSMATATAFDLRHEYENMSFTHRGIRTKTLISNFCDAKLSTGALLMQLLHVYSIIEHGTSQSPPILDTEGIKNGYLTPEISLDGPNDNMSSGAAVLKLKENNTFIFDVANGSLDPYLNNPNVDVSVEWTHNGADFVMPFSKVYFNSSEANNITLEGSLNEYARKLTEEFDLFGVSNPLGIANELTEEFDSALDQHANSFLEKLSQAMVGLDDSVNSFIEQLDFKHGLRLNLVTEHNLKDDDFFDIETSKFLRKLFNTNSEVGEEERVGRVHYETDLSGGRYEKMMTIPIAAFERKFSTSEACSAMPVFPGRDFKTIIINRDKEMIDSLSKEDDYRSFYEFSIPYRRIATGLAIHSTSMLAGYSTMPNVLTSTRASLASIFKIAAQRSNLNGLPSNIVSSQVEQEFDAISFGSQLGADFPAGGELPNCFSFDGINGDWFKMIGEMIEQFILYFPSVIFRGIADQLDPAYKEMKSHFYACELSDLNMSGLAISAGNDETEFGLRGESPMNKEYIPINTAFPYDVVKGVGKMINPFNSDGGAYLGKSVNRMVSYVIGAPAQLLDSSYAFQIPCKDDVTGNFRNWEKYKVGGDGRYGHPLSLFTLLALPTKQLPRDLEYRRRMCVIQENNTNEQNSGRQIDECSDTEE